MAGSFGFWRKAPCPFASGPEIEENKRALRERISVPGSSLEADFAGAVIPIMLKRLGHDPAQLSSIILTTATDTADFFSFLIGELPARWRTDAGSAIFLSLNLRKPRQISVIKK